MSRRRAARPPKRRDTRDSTLRTLLSSADGRNLVAAALARRRQRLDVIDSAVPPQTLLEAVVREIRERTDLPPEIGVAVTHALLSAALVESGSTVQWPDSTQQIELCLWLVVLGPSASGKTLIRKIIERALGITVTNLPEPGSARAYLDGLAEVGGRALWARDEYGQLTKQIADGGPLGNLRDYLLRTYDHDVLETNTHASGDTRVEHPVLSILGGSVDTTWSDCIDAAMLTDGLLARHQFILAARRPLSVPRYPVDAIEAAIRVSVARVDLGARLREREEYRIGRRAAEWYDTAWIDMVGQLGERLDPAYVRRITWNTTRYAVIYHLLLGNPGVEIATDAMRWAWRMTQLHLQYALETLSLSDASFAARLDGMLSWLDEYITGHPAATEAELARALLQRWRRDLQSASEARGLIDLAMRYRAGGSDGSTPVPARPPALPPVATGTRARTPARAHQWTPPRARQRRNTATDPSWSVGALLAPAAYAYVIEFTRKYTRVGMLA